MSLVRMLVAIFGLLPSLAVAWGPDGHSIVGQVAWQLLSSDEQSKVRSILGGDDLAAVANWADHLRAYRQEWGWSFELHFINTPDGACDFSYNRDCKDEAGLPDHCVAGAIINYTQQLVGKGPIVQGASLKAGDCDGLHKDACLADKSCEWDYDTHHGWETACKAKSGPQPGPSPGPTPGPSPGPSPHPVPSADLANALKFVTHFVGDIHQPLHVGWTTDRGGNTIKVKEGFENDLTKNLHQVWDDGIIDKTKEVHGYSDWNGYAANLSTLVGGAWSSDATQWSKCLHASDPDLKSCITEMASESIKFACTVAYKDDHDTLITNKEELDQGYYDTRSPIIDQRLAAGGVRLAELVKYIVSRMPSEAETIIV